MCALTRPTLASVSEFLDLLADDVDARIALGKCFLIRLGWKRLLRCNEQTHMESVSDVLNSRIGLYRACSLDNRVIQCSYKHDI